MTLLAGVLFVACAIGTVLMIQRRHKAMAFCCLVLSLFSLLYLLATLLLLGGID